MKNKKTESVVIKDSGKRQKFKTGAVRDIQVGKGRLDLLPAYAIIEIAKHFEAGALKYNPNNWRRGMPLSRFIDSGLRHIFKYMAGEKDENHLVAGAWNLVCALETRELIKQGKLPKEFDDLPYNQKS